MATPEIDALQQRIAELEAQNRLLETEHQLTHRSMQLREVIRWQPDDTHASWAQRLLNTATQTSDSFQACLYLANLGETYLHLAATVAYPQSALPETIVPGDGVLGQAVLSRKAFHLHGIELKSTSVTSLATIQPKQAYIQPLCYNDAALGVLELLSMSTFTPEHQFLLGQLTESAAMQWASKVGIYAETTQLPRLESPLVFLQEIAAQLSGNFLILTEEYIVCCASDGAVQFMEAHQKYIYRNETEIWELLPQELIPSVQHWLMQVWEGHGIDVVTQWRSATEKIRLSLRNVRGYILWSMEPYTPYSETRSY